MSLDYLSYIKKRALVGFETQKGCYESCTYCSEGNRRVIFKKPVEIVDELESLSMRGVKSYHLCDTEFNQDLAHCKAFLNELVDRRIGISWAGVRCRA